MFSDQCEIVFKSATQRKRLAKRALEGRLGRKLKPGEVTRHRCDVAGCVNPDHLEPGSTRDNLLDAFSRKRHPVKVLPLTMRQEIWDRYHFGGITQTELSAQYGVSQVRISQITRVPRCQF